MDGCWMVSLRPFGLGCGGGTEATQPACFAGAVNFVGSSIEELVII
jgi:hypothetical protein